MESASPSSFCFMRQAASSLVTTIPKVKVRQSRLSASSVFGLTSNTTNSEAKEPGRLSMGNRRPVSVHVSSYLKAKDPVQTLVKYFDELTHTPSPTSHLTPAPQAAQVWFKPFTPFSSPVCSSHLSFSILAVTLQSNLLCRGSCTSSCSFLTFLPSLFPLNPLIDVKVIINFARFKKASPFFWSFFFQNKTLYTWFMDRGKFRHKYCEPRHRQ